MKGRRGVSPVIATVLLVTMVIVVGLIIFLWFNSLTQEAVTKFGGKNIELVCGDVDFSSSYDGSALAISNNGNVPIFNMKVKISTNGGFETKDIKDISSNWPSVGLKRGGSFLSNDVSTEFSGATDVLLIPVLVGTSDSGEQSHVCAEQNGQEVFLA